MRPLLHIDLLYISVSESLNNIIKFLDFNFLITNVVRNLEKPVSLMTAAMLHTQKTCYKIAIKTTKKKRFFDTNIEVDKRAILVFWKILASF
jgi:hypothetical protein